MILDKFPAIDDFYQNYWGKRAFVVRGAIENSVFEGLIDGDELAALSLEEDVRSRIISTLHDDDGDGDGDEARGAWDCKHGPFSPEDFDGLGTRDWSLLVQNVEQYHTETAALLNAFNFAPRWLMDDIMISYSATGGSVGPHTDSYHVFLVQGQGKRRWRVGQSALRQAQMIKNDKHLVLQDGFVGESYEVEMGDVIYIPPHFAHEGVTLEPAMTFSVGFLGPKISELMVEYGQYLEQQDDAANPRYVGQNLNAQSAGRCIDGAAVSTIKDALGAALEGADFAQWLAQYFSLPTHADRDDVSARSDDALDKNELEKVLQNGAKFACAPFAKAALITDGTKQIQDMALYGEKVALDGAMRALISELESGSVLSWDMAEAHGGWAKIGGFVTALYNKYYLEEV